MTDGAYVEIYGGPEYDDNEMPGAYHQRCEACGEWMDEREDKDPSGAFCDHCYEDLHDDDPDPSGGPASGDFASMCDAELEAFATRMWIATHAPAHRRWFYTLLDVPAVTASAERNWYTADASQ